MAILPNKLQATYKKMFGHVARVFQEEFNQPLRPSLVTVDFEKSAMNAMIETFHIDPTGCQFHLKQAWERKFRKYGMDTRRKDIPRTFLEFIDVLNGAIYLNVNWEWTKYFLDMYMNNIRMHVESKHSNFPPALLEPFRKCFDYLKKNYFTEGGKYFVGKFANYSQSIADSHFVCTNNRRNLRRSWPTSTRTDETDWKNF